MDLGLRCETPVYINDSDFYNVTLRVEMSSAFTPAIIEAIDYLRLDRIAVNDMGNTVSVLLDRRLLHTNVTAIEDVFRDEIQPRREAKEHYDYTVCSLADIGIVVQVFMFVSTLYQIN